MDKYDVDDILYDGNEEEIRKVRCSECGGYMEFSFYMEETVKPVPATEITRKAGVLEE